MELTGIEPVTPWVRCPSAFLLETAGSRFARGCERLRARPTRYCQDDWEVPALTMPLRLLRAA
jgi:hypothetical protein